MSQNGKGDTKGASETYKKLQVVWKNAEPSFPPYDNYMELGQQLGLAANE